MNQATLYHFSIQKNQNVYIFEMLPGSPWEEIFSSLDEFKAKFMEARDKAVEDAKKKEAEAASQGEAHAS